MSELEKFVEMFNESADGRIHTEGSSIFCDRIEVEENKIWCYKGETFCGAIYLAFSAPHFVTKDNHYVRYFEGEVVIS